MLQGIKYITCAIILISVNMLWADTFSQCDFRSTKASYYIKSAEITKDNVRIVWNPKENKLLTHDIYQGIIVSVCKDLISCNIQCKINSIHVLNKDEKQGWIFNKPCEYCQTFSNCYENLSLLRSTNELIEKHSTPIGGKK